MASMGTVYPYGHLIRSARTGVTFVPRRTITYTPIRRAQDDSNNGPENNSDKKSSPSAISSIKNFFFGKKDAEKPKITHRPTPSPGQNRQGSLDPGSIFADEKGPAPSPKHQGQPESGQLETTADFDVDQRNWESMQHVLDPRPRARETWERKMITREIRRRGRLSKPIQIMRTERECLAKSHFFKTSVKKLGPLARQIAGKNVDEAILQMKFSKKKAAQDVLDHLIHAKNLAVVRNGLGIKSPEDKDIAKDPITVILNSGEKKVITDPSAIYIAQAWVNRGPFGEEPDYRAHGRVHRMRPPHTGISVLLKEEKTRIREWKEREAKALRQRRTQLWTHLPDRPITAQNQYYSW
ncbi:Ribosomal protein [Aspergillus sclerotialis]|uniref:Ribosomal protein n=1 Tax=Aspergillus sclerotialis TaxID=2070753 RepID=A0A3A2ZGP2_9EURO|nr:Ribosomal protein [Aspergillus sclerotialis]